MMQIRNLSKMLMNIECGIGILTNVRDHFLQIVRTCCGKIFRVHWLISFRHRVDRRTIQLLFL